MSNVLKRVDVSHHSDLSALLDKVRDSGKACILQRNGEELAILLPFPPKSDQHSGREKSREDYEAFISSAGGWSGLVDGDNLIENIHESRRRSIKPPAKL